MVHQEVLAKVCRSAVGIKGLKLDGTAGRKDQAPFEVSVRERIHRLIHLEFQAMQGATRRFRDFGEYPWSVAE